MSQQSRRGAALPPSLWAASSREPAVEAPPLRGEEEAEVVVVGGGFAGLSTALHLAEAGKAVRLLEAAEPGWGASGRNGGQINPGLKLLPEELRARFGAEAGNGAVRVANGSCDLVCELIARHAIECDLLRPGLLIGAFGRRGLAEVEDWVRQWSAEGVDVELLDRRGMADLVGSEAYDGGLIDRRGGNIQPLAYARGLARAAKAAGAAIHGASPAMDVSAAGRGWRVTTPEGHVTAPALVICTNGYTDSFWPGLAQAVVPVESFMAATAPLGENLRGSILPGGHALFDTRYNLLHFRKDRDGRLAVGGRGPLGGKQSARDTRHVREAILKLYPALEGETWDFHWHGRVAMTLDKLPRLASLAPGVWAGLGFNGRGVAMATMLGRELARAASGEQPDMPIVPVRPVPFHAFRHLAIAARMAWGRWKDGREGVPK